jgi:hypothetical protein
MSEKDKQLLCFIDQLIEDAPTFGVLPLPFMILKERVEEIMKERDQALGVIE